MIPGILIYLDDLNIFDDVLTDEDIGAVIRALSEYARTGKDGKSLSPIATVFYRTEKAKLIREMKKYESKVENGKQGGLAKRTEANGSETKRNQAKPSESKRTEETETETETETVTETLSESVSAHDARGWKEPTLDEVRKYAGETGIRTDCEAFYLYYKARGWMMGKTPMQDWQTALKGWEHIGTTSPKGGKSKPRLESERPYIRADMTGTSWDIIREALMDAEKEQNLKIIQGGRKNEAV